MEKQYFIAEIQVIVNGNDLKLVRVHGKNFDPNIAKRNAENQVRNTNPSSSITSKVVTVDKMTFEEQQARLAE